MKPNNTKQSEKRSVADQIATAIEEVCKKLNNEEIEPTAANFKWAAGVASRALEFLSKNYKTIPFKRCYVAWIPPFVELIRNIEGERTSNWGSSIFPHTEYVYGSADYNDIDEAMNMLIPQIEVMIKELKIYIPAGMENFYPYWDAQLGPGGRGCRYNFCGCVVRHFLKEIASRLEVVSNRPRAHKDNNIIIYNSPSPKGTGIYSNNNTSNSNIFLMDGEEDSADKRKKKVPKKGGGRWQTGPGKKMIDDFLDWRSKDRTATDSKLLAMRVWKNPRYKDFVDKMINHSKGPKASEYTFNNSFYPACMRALNCKNAE